MIWIVYILNLWQKRSCTSTVGPIIWSHQWIITDKNVKFLYFRTCTLSMLTCSTPCTTRITTSCPLARSTWPDTWWTKWQAITPSYSSMVTPSTVVSSWSEVPWAAWQPSWRSKHLPSSIWRMSGSTSPVCPLLTPTLVPCLSVAAPMQVNVNLASTKSWSHLLFTWIDKKLFWWQLSCATKIYLSITDIKWDHQFLYSKLWL